MVVNNNFFYQTYKNNLKKSLNESSYCLKSSSSVNQLFINKNLNISEKISNASNNSLLVKKDININNIKSSHKNSFISIYNNECKKSNFNIENNNSNEDIYKITKASKRSFSNTNIKTYGDWIQKRPTGISFFKIVEALRRPVATSALVHPVFVFFFFFLLI